MNGIHFFQFMFGNETKKKKKIVFNQNEFIAFSMFTFIVSRSGF